MFSKTPSIKLARFSPSLLALVFTFLLLRPLYPQVAGATLSGTVTDQSGGVVANAGISIKNVATGITRAVKTDTAGFYSAPNLLPGNYEITAAAPGFSSQVQSGAVLTVGAQQVLNFVLQVGQVTQTVEVTSAAPTVELASSAISAVVSATTVRELPLNGRSWTDLATLQPGVASIQTQPGYSAGPDRGKRGFGNQITVAGARPQQNNYRLDGISINDYDNAAPGSVIGGDLGVDAIEEFSVLTSNYSSEYGRTSGGVVNAITRSGTNQFHGSVYEFLRNNALDARNFFDGAIPPFHRNQFGADAGGPIRKDKIFIFGDYEGIRQSKGISNLDTVPSIAARQGNLCSAPDTGTCSPNSMSVDASVQKYLPFWPLPNGGIQPGTDGDIGRFTFAGQQVVKENFFTVRVDDKFSDKDSLAATYLGDITPYSAPDSLNDVLLSSRTNRQLGVLEETHIFRPALVNSTRVGYSRVAVLNNVGLTAINSLANDPTLAAIPGQFAAQVVVSGLTQFTGGVKANGPGQFFWNSFQVYDDAFWTHGTHSIKFGAAVERMQLNINQLSESSGTFSFPTVADFLLNQPSRFTAAISSNTEAGVRQSLLGFYVQDDWRARTNLTLNLGLRWEMTTLPSEVHGKIATLIHITDATPQVGSPLPVQNSTLRNFDPRVGFAWDPFRNGKTAVRGGFGVFDVLPLINVYYPPVGVFPFNQTGFLQDLTVLPGTFYAGAAALFTPKSRLANFSDQTGHRSYDMQWNLTVQRELARNLTLLVGYVGSRGVHLPNSNNDRNIVLPRKTSAGYLFPQVDVLGNVFVAGQCNQTDPNGSDPAQCNPASKINDKFGDIAGILYSGDSFYHGLEVGVRKAMNHGVALQGSFTWNKSIDTGSAGGVGDQFSNSIGAPPWYDLKSIRGLSDFDVGRTLVVSATWQIPSPRSFSGPAAWIASGWELGAIYKANDGVPFTPTFGTDADPQGLNSSDTWDFPNRLTGPGCTTLTNPGNPNTYIKTQCFSVPSAPDMTFWSNNCDPAPPTLGGPIAGSNLSPLACFNLRGNGGRNILIGPGTSNLDLSVFKNNAVKRISESFNVQFRAEIFNALNRANFAVPVTPDNTDIFDSRGAPTGVAGLLKSTTTTAREIQFALKVIW
ncbi:MAG: hypothetical protein DMG32_24190 [Acidobacteria bacterium]|nr:MAG: hypothetical protein DMG32_24190 [Acidobacteriota bacterium]